MQPTVAAARRISTTVSTTNTATDYATLHADSIIKRAAKNLGKGWDRLSGDGRLVECKAILCTDIITDVDVRGESKTVMPFWAQVNARLVNMLIPE